jgi:hypothetical protein
VWEGPSLKELVAQQSASARRAETPASVIAPDPDQNIEPVDPSDLPAVWQSLLNLLSQKGMGLASIVSHGRLVSVNDGKATIQFSKQHDTFVRMFEKNGKKEALRDAFSQVLNQNVGVAFEIESTTTQTAAVTAPPPVFSSSEARPSVVRREVTTITSEPVLQPPPARLTAEQRELAERDPLVRAILDELGGIVVKVE